MYKSAVSGTSESQDFPVSISSVWLPSIRCLVGVFGLCVLLAGVASADQRVIVRVLGGEPVLHATCSLLGCNVIRSLDDPASQVFLVGIADTTDRAGVLISLSSAPSILNAELDEVIELPRSDLAVPDALQEARVPYFGEEARYAHNGLGVSGTGIVAVIDTGVDTSHPVLEPAMVSGYDFTCHQRNAAEATGGMKGLEQSTAAVVDSTPERVPQGNIGRALDQSTPHSANSAPRAAFGHGTATSGIIHVVAPGAMIMPLKAFGSDGIGYTSDTLRAIYWAVRSNAKVISMSFSMPRSSAEMRRAVAYAVRSGTICVTAVDPRSSWLKVPQAGSRNGSDIASTGNDDLPSGPSIDGAMVWMAAPREGVMSTYPHSSYASIRGTSLSTAFVAGFAHLLLQVYGSLSPSAAAIGIADPEPVSPSKDGQPAIQAVPDEPQPE